MSEHKGRAFRRRLFHPACLCFLCLCLTNTFLSFAQTPDLQIDGTVRGDDKRLSGARIQVLQDGVSFDQMTTSINGKFYFELPLDHMYLLIYSKPGFVTKRISINTNGIPEKLKKNGFSYGGWEVALFSEVEGLDVSILDKPIGKIIFNSSDANFDYDKDYTKSIQDELTRMQKELIRLNNQYKALIQQGDVAMNTEKFEEAIGYYQQAIKIKPKQDYPKKQIEKANKLMAEQQRKAAELLSREKAYQAIITKADEGFRSRSYKEAKSDYAKASEIFPDRPYPKEQIAKINKMLAAQKASEDEKKAIEQKYSQLIAKADQAFAAKQYIGAKANYQSASSLKPNEQYPKDRIAEINGLMSRQQAQKELEEKYNHAVSRGNSAFAAAEYEKANAAFREALDLKPDEPYPKKRLQDIEEKLKALSNQKATEEKYMAAIKKGNAYFEAKQYMEAKKAYREALTIKEQQSYPKNRIAEIDRILKEMEAAKSLDERYSAAIEQADDALHQKNYQSALALYKDASGLKPAETYPKQKIAELNALISKLEKKRSLEARYNSLISQANTAFDGKRYANSRTLYVSALELKPDEAYPQQRIDEIDKIMAEQKKNAALSKQYNDLIKKADETFRSKDYAAARSFYQNALELKPEETYPAAQIAEIDHRLRLLNEAEEQEKKYAGLIASADQKFQMKKFKDAKKEYKQASQLKPLEAYPRDQIKKIDQILDDMSAQLNKQRQAKEALYKKAISEGDFYFTTKDYENARVKYRQALQIKPDAARPKSQLARINQLLAGNATDETSEMQYKEYIAKADALFKSLQYSEAKIQYAAAARIKPFAEYPKRKLLEISTALKDREAKAKAEAERKRRIAMLEEQRRRNQEIANKVNEGQNKQQEQLSEEEEEFMTELAKKYPPGITEMEVQDGSQTILKRIVVKGNRGYEYKRVIHSWGGRFYFKNGHPITERVWTQETSPESLSNE